MRRFSRGERGAAAVEFALIALPFFALLMGIIEVGMIFLISTTLEDATNLAARQIRIGAMQSQATPETASAFQAAICSHLTWLGSSCASNLEVDVRTFSQFQSVTLPNPIASGKLQPQSQLQFRMGGPGEIVLVRAYYPWNLIAPHIDGMTAQTSGGQTLITATATFRNEPYPSTP
ncbi:TadE/TadG family type IV pilus assembly protein [Phenylobacterium montanum]|uniref:Pilus assembly protein n=1 Tax=Phenylobacterium montanum TaxID=2823693 RepID=A0A975FWL8_9CAUL|nr:TadE/TadG family type IV pilus assembly protein [Caulobacter sp. S6]QUD86750.1 pilus assembly protein [Caulobacter sp. S6]